MPNKAELFIKEHLKKNLSDAKPGDTVKVYLKIKEKDKDKIQVFEGLVLARKHGKGITSTITVRRVIAGVGVEKIFPLHSPIIDKIEIKKRSKVRRAKLYYLRTAKGKKSRLKRKDFIEAIGEPVAVESEALLNKPEETAPEINQPTEAPSTQ